MATSEPARPSESDSSGESDLATLNLASVPTSRYWLFGVLAIVGAVADLWTKQVVFDSQGLPGQSDIVWVIDGYFGIETAVNIGAVFGIGAGKGLLFAIISVFAFFGILIWLFWFRGAVSAWLTFAMGCITGGIIGNLYDRLGMWWKPGYPDEWRSGVRDWILWQASDELKWPNFNIADSLLVTGAIMLVVQSIFFPPPMMVADADDASSNNKDSNNENSGSAEPRDGSELSKE